MSFSQVQNGSRSNAAKKARLLIVDDNHHMLETLGDILQERGYQIETAITGKEAIMKSEEHFFNIALIDIKLLDMTGIEVLQTFRKKYPFRLNIMITAYATLQNTIDALNLGANAYIMKPIDHEKLDQMIRQCLEKQREALKITKEKLVEFTEEAMANKWEERRQCWESQKATV